METTALGGAQLRTDYLQLFVTQIQNQNPLEPMDQDAFLTQLSQFSMVEGIENIGAQLKTSAQSSKLNQATELVGKGVTYQSSFNDQFEAGIVKEVFIDRDGLFARVNNETVSLSQISSVFSAT
jgi:flagellar basal-body rod modification protein FlgD